MHRWSILIIVQQDATQSRLLVILQVHSKCFQCQPHPFSGVHRTVTTASSTSHIFCAATSLQCGQAVVTVLCTPDGGCGWHPKHVEWTCRIINRLLCVAFRWTIINVHERRPHRNHKITDSHKLLAVSLESKDTENLFLQAGHWAPDVRCHGQQEVYEDDHLHIGGS